MWMLLGFLLVAALVGAAIISGGHVIEGNVGPIPYAGAPGAGTAAVQTITIDAAGGTFRLMLDGYETADIAWSATNNTLRDNVDAALEALPNIGTGGVVTAVGTMTAGVGTLTCTFGKKPVNTMTVSDNSLTGNATCSVATTTPGVAPTPAGVAPGGLVQDITNGKLYINTGTQLAPTWTVVGSQS